MSAVKTKKQVTEWGNPMDPMDSQWGEIRYRDWLVLECARWQNKDFRQGWIEQNSAGLIAMFSDSNDVLDLGAE